MLEIKRIIATFLLPPGIVIILLLISAWYFRKSCKKLFISNILLALLLWMFSISVISDHLIGLLEVQSTANIPKERVDSIILLGGGLYDGVPDLNGTSAPTEDMFTRIVCAFRLYRRFNVPIIVSGGAPPEFISPEAIVVRRFLIDMGVPEKHIIIEEKSRDTMENARNVAAICSEKGYVNPVVVTSAYHAKRASIAFNIVHMKIALVASNFKSSANRHYGWAAYLPTAESVESSWRSMREYIGLFYYSFM